MKKRYAIIAIIGLLIFGIVFFAGPFRHRKGHSNEANGGKKVKKETTQTKETKPMQSVETTQPEPTPPIQIIEENYANLPNELHSWWIKRNKDHVPSGAQDIVDLEKYNAYYLDSNADEKVMYLTFDCGYENNCTPSMLDTLKQEEVPAMFFVTQTYIRDNLELIQRMKEEGHLVGNHTVSHPSLPKQDAAANRDEWMNCEEYMQEATGYPMDKYARPPMGEYSERTLQISKDLGYKTVFWSFVYMDYQVNNQPGEGYVLDLFKQYHHNGGIILMHNISKTNEKALPAIIQYLKGEGYRFGSLDEISNTASQ